MPRDGSGVYTQPFPDVVAGTTIESAKYNGNVNDVEQDLNTPRPIVAGGTGANNAADAATNLGLVSVGTDTDYTEAEKTQARSNISAAPLDALAYNGIQVNGSMEVSQERGSASTGTFSGLKYIIDGWRASTIGSGVYNASQNTTTYPPGFSSSLQLWVTTANPSPAAGDLAVIEHPIEGYRISRLGWGTASASPITIGFWIYAKRLGTYSGAVLGGGSTYPFTFTIAAGDTWEFKTVTIPGPTFSTWPKDNTIGMYLVFTMMAGSSRTAPAGAWTAGGFYGATGTINGSAATNDTMLVTGVVVLPGIEAPSAERSALIMRPYTQELLTCQRYFYGGVPTTRGVISSGGIAARMGMRHPVPMRAAPSLNLTWGFQIFDGVEIRTAGTVSANYSTTNSLEFDMNVAPGFTAGGRAAVSFEGDGNMFVDARL